MIKILFHLFLISFVFAQTDQRDYDNELRYQNKAINGLKNEIEQLRSKIKKAESKERSASYRITSLDQEIALTSRLIQSLKKEEEKTKSGILLPDTAEKERPEQGKVIAVGPGRVDDNGKRISLEVKKGNIVLFAKYGPNEIKIDGKEYLIAKGEDILAVIE